MSQKMMERAESLAVRASRRMFLDWLAGWGALAAAGLAALLMPQPAEAAVKKEDPGQKRCCKYFRVCGDSTTSCGGFVCQEKFGNKNPCPAPPPGCFSCHNDLVLDCASCV